MGVDGGGLVVGVEGGVGVGFVVGEEVGEESSCLFPVFALRVSVGDVEESEVDEGEREGGDAVVEERTRGLALSVILILVEEAMAFFRISSSE